MMIKKGNNKDPQEASKDEGLTRRGAIKRIAAGLAGAGIVAVIGIMGQVQAPTSLNPNRRDDKSYDTYDNSAH